MAKLPQFRSVQDKVLIRGFTRRVHGLANPADVRQVVGALRFDHLDPKTQPNEIPDIGNFQRHRPAITVRLDRQANTSSGAANLQIQVNNVALREVRANQGVGTTIAQVIVPAAIYQAAFACREPNVRVHLESVVRSALNASHASVGAQFTIVDG